MAYKVVSLFSGCGGSSCGYKFAGMKVLLANEFIPIAADTYQANFPDTIVLRDDIRKLTGKDILSKINMQEGELDLLDGSPPCFADDVLVMTSKGYKQIKDIKIDDYVLTHKNRFKKVLNTSKIKRKKIVDVKIAGCHWFKVTENHPFYVREKIKKKTGKRYKNNKFQYKRFFQEPEWKLLKDIDKNYHIGIAINKKARLPYWNGVSLYGNQFKKSELKSNSLSRMMKKKDFWWIIGRYIGDGWLRYEPKKCKHSVKICCSKNNNEKEEIMNKIKKFFHCYAHESRTTYKITIMDKELVLYLLQFGKYAYGKKLTNDIFDLPKRLLRSFLDGYFSADGNVYIRKKIKKYHCLSASKELIFGIQACIHKVYNVFCTLHFSNYRNDHIIEGRKVYTRPHYSLSYDLNKDYRDDAFFENNHLWVPFRKKKELIWNDYVYNLEVEEDSSYSVYNLIVHNCQGFSTSGKGSEKWGKVVKYSETYQRTDDLFYEYARILSDIKPKVFVAENVYGMAIGESKIVFNAVLNELKSKGYKVKCRLLNAKYFNVAQNRPRLIWIGVREDLNVEPSHPTPQTRPTAIQDVLKNIMNEESELKASRYKETSSVYAYLLKMKPGESGSDYNEKGSYFGLLRLSWDKPANTILQSDAKHISCSAIHPDEHRRLTITELKRISSFPDDFILLGNYKQKWERIGRAVCPNMMKAIAEHVRYRILNKIYNIEEEYNPLFYNAEEEEKGQDTFDFIREYTNFREYK